MRKKQTNKRSNSSTKCFTLTFLMFQVIFMIVCGSWIYSSTQEPAEEEADNIQNSQKKYDNENNAFSIETSSPIFSENFFSDDQIDPLDDFNFLDGGYHKALTPESAKLCDEDFNVMYKDSWRCPSDVTCLSCTVKYQNRFKDLQDAFDFEDIKERRRRKILDNLNFIGAQTANTAFQDRSTVKSTIVSLLGVNYGQLYLLLNFLCSLEELEVNYRTIIVIPTDEDAEKSLVQILEQLPENKRFQLISTEWMNNLNQKISKTYSGAAMSGDHSTINNVILLQANELVQLGFDVILHDVDIAWKRDVPKYLLEAGKRRDILGMIAPNWCAKGIVNSGFVYVRNTRKSRILMQSLVNIAPLKRKSDQVLWNSLLRHPYLGQVEYRVLPQVLFYKYSGHRAESPDHNKALLFHAVGNRKMSHFKEFGFWFYKETCPFYIAELTLPRE
eukprot:maker-scaffold_8-snap-gene-7.20-mRNA-1 protein AED:0.00 eAED:0.00 QI:63/1/1/1/1/1/2/93/443